MPYYAQIPGLYDYSLQRPADAPLFQSNAYGYNPLRGMLVPRKMGLNSDVSGYDIERAFKFQFNPTDIEFNRMIRLTERDYYALDYGDHVWSGGGGKTINFNIFLDATAGSHYAFFQKTSLTGQESHNDSIKAYPRGVMPTLELIESFGRPEIPDAQGKFKTPRFFQGEILEKNQFYPPPVLMFVVGPIYLACLLSNFTYRTTLFDRGLYPIRAEGEIQLSVIESSFLKLPKETGGARATERL